MSLPPPEEPDPYQAMMTETVQQLVAAGLVETDAINIEATVAALEEGDTPPGTAIYLIAPARQLPEEPLEDEVLLGALRVLTSPDWEGPELPPGGYAVRVAPAGPDANTIDLEPLQGLPVTHPATPRVVPPGERPPVAEGDPYGFCLGSFCVG
jgi:hypothetical protein